MTAFIGPSGCGKSTLLRNFNRMNELIDGVHHEGEILLNGRSIYDKKIEVIALRRSIGMVFQKSNPFPEIDLRKHRLFAPHRRGKIPQCAGRSRRAQPAGAALWEEAKDRLHDSALGLSGGQMQRLCIARAIANRPEVLLMDEPCSALDPIATAKVEDLIHELKRQFTIVIVTHNMQQATRCSDPARPFSTSASSSSLTTPRKFSATRAKNKRRTTSPVVSVDRLSQPCTFSAILKKPSASCVITRS